jgi:hypothetical protein
VEDAEEAPPASESTSPVVEETPSASEDPSASEAEAGGGSSGV